jgi:manganese transport protein
MEGFLHIRLPAWLRRLVTRLLALVPALITIVWFGEESTGSLLVLSQVVLSLQLSFAVIPLVLFTSDPRRMGVFVNPKWLTGVAWAVGLVIAALNAWLLVQTVGGWLAA